MSKLQNGVPGSYQVITPPNLLRAKVGGGTGFDKHIIERAETAIANHAEDFLPQAEASLSAMNATIKEAAGNYTADTKTRIFSTVFELKATGGMFDFPLVSLIANNLCLYLDRIQVLDKRSVEIITAHYDAMRAVIANRITGEGGAVGDRLFTSLHELTNRPNAA